MKKTTAFLIAISFLAITCFAACKSSKKAKYVEVEVTEETVMDPPREQQEKAQPASEQTRSALLPIVLDTEVKGSDAFQIGDVRINGDTLFLDVTYSGGCKEHVFSGRHDGNIMKSLPPQLNIFIDHVANGDGCRSLISKTLSFDLTNCRSGKTGSIVLIINGDRSKKVTYSY